MRLRSCRHAQGASRATQLGMTNNSLRTVQKGGLSILNDLVAVALTETSNLQQSTIGHQGDGGKAKDHQYNRFHRRQRGRASAAEIQFQRRDKK